MSPAPNRKHQAISIKLSVYFFRHCNNKPISYAKFTLRLLMCD